MRSYAKTRVAISADEWTAIVAPIGCNYFGLKNSDGTELRMRTACYDAGTEDTLPASTQEVVIAPVLLSSGERFRFAQGETILWVRATSGVGPVVTTWVT